MALLSTPAAQTAISAISSVDLFNKLMTSSDLAEGHCAINELAARSNDKTAVSMLAEIVTWSSNKEHSSLAIDQLGKLANRGNRDAICVLNEKFGYLTPPGVVLSSTFRWKEEEARRNMWTVMATTPEAIPNAALFFATRHNLPAGVAVSLVENADKLDEAHRWKVLGAIAESPGIPTQHQLRAVENLAFGEYNSSLARTVELMRIQGSLKAPSEVAAAALAAVIPYLSSRSCSHLIKGHEICTQMTDALLKEAKKGASLDALFNIALLNDPKQRGQSNYALMGLVNFLSEAENAPVEVFDLVRKVAGAAQILPTDRAELIRTLGSGLGEPEVSARTALDVLRDNRMQLNESGRPTRREVIPDEVRLACMTALGDLLASKKLSESLRSEVVSTLRGLRREFGPMADAASSSLRGVGGLAGYVSAGIDFFVRWKSVLKGGNN